jgi:hypothetical protein
MREDIDVSSKTSDAPRGESDSHKIARSQEDVGPRFTAVNGEAYRRPDGHTRDSLKESTQKLSRLTTEVHTPSLYGQHGWRAAEYIEPDVRSDSALQQSPDSTKRKRDDNESVQESRREHPSSTGRDSPKRRAVGSGSERHTPRPDKSRSNDAAKTVTQIPITHPSR